MSALILAIKNDQAEIIAMKLIEMHADVNATDEVCRFGLLNGAWSETQTCCSQPVCEQFLDVAQVGNPALALAINSGRAEIAMKLIEMIANINAADTVRALFLCGSIA